jgi:hypothetical protein
MEGLPARYVVDGSRYDVPRHKNQPPLHPIGKAGVVIVGPYPSAIRRLVRAPRPRCGASKHRMTVELVEG